MTRKMSGSSPTIFDGNLGAHAREHMIESVRDRLFDVERDWQHPPGARRSAMIASLPRVSSFRSTSISEEWTPSACSSSSARPRAPTQVAINRVARGIDDGHRRLSGATFLGNVPSAQAASELDVRKDEIDLMSGLQQ
jgi:hypothetical protein